MTIRLPAPPRSAVLALSAGLLAALGAQAQTSSGPSAGDLLRDAERATARPPAAALPAAAAPAPGPSGSGTTVQVGRFDVQGARSIDAATLQAALQPWVGQRHDLAALARAADAVAELYRARGLLARAWLPEQSIRDGVVRIQVVEGRLAALRIERRDAPRAVSDDQARRMLLARQREGELLQVDAMQRAVALLNELPGQRAASLLEPGDAEGETRLVLALTDAPLVSGTISADNTGARSTGTARLVAGLALNGPLARGDQWTASAALSEGSRYLRLGGSLPVGSDGWRAGVQASGLDYGYSLNGARYTGNAATLGATASHALLRGSDTNADLRGELQTKRFRNRVAGATLSDKRIDLLTLGMSGDRSDGFGGGGVWAASAELALGRLDLAGNAADLAADQVANGPGRQGRFGRALVSLSRTQRLSDRQTLTVAAVAQLADGNLDASEKLALAGPGAVRAYSTSEPGVDSGAVLNIDWKIKLAERWTLGFFHDEASGQRDQRSNLATLSPNQLHFSGSGLELQATLPEQGLQLRAALATRHGRNPARNPATGADADGTSRSTRLLLTLAKWF
jgi:hemolysin activation/secretion protein